jgi:hypothetical protein
MNMIIFQTKSFCVKSARVLIIHYLAMSPPLLPIAMFIQQPNAIVVIALKGCDIHKRILMMRERI